MILFPRLHFNMMTRSKAMAAPRPRGAACEDKNTRLKKAIICMKAQELKAKRAEVVKQVEKNKKAMILKKAQELKAKRAEVVKKAELVKKKAEVLKKTQKAEVLKKTKKAVLVVNRGEGRAPLRIRGTAAEDYGWLGRSAWAFFPSG